jgi:hypothetical protein
MMRRLRGCGAGSGGDEGAVLVIVLIVLTVLSLGLSALLTFADTGERTTVAMTSQAARLAEANGAVEVAMNALRRGQYNNSPGQSCFGGSNTLPNLIASATGGVTYSAAVTCQPVPGSGGSGSLVPVTSSNKPGYAVQTLSTSGSEDGIQVKSLGGGSDVLKVHGQVLSNSTVTVTNGKLVADNGVFATGACTLAGITSTPAPSCNRGTTVGDPGYAGETPSLTYRPLSSVTCSTPNSVVSFQPGYYDDAAGLTAMMAGNSACKHSTWWFRPGVYYFDFHNGENAALPNGSHRWVVDDGTLVAGTPSGGAAQPPVNPTLPGACVSPITSTSAVGVQFIFGGDSRLQVDAGKAEICASYHSDRPPIAVYGQRSGSPSATGPVTLSGTSATSSKFATPAGALTPNDGSIATWNPTTTSPATLTVSGMATGSSVPAGSQLTAATLAVRRMNTKGNKNDTVNLTLTPAAGGSPVVVSVPTSTTTGWQDTTADLMSTTLPDVVHGYGFTSASALYSVTPKTGGGTESLDGVQLTLTYTVPSLRAENATVNGSPSCVGKVGYGSGGTCAALSTTSAPGSVVYIQGAAYLPLAAVDITLNNVSSQVFKFGVVARVLAVKINGSSTFDQAVIELPDNSPGYGFTDTDVLLTAYVCPGSATCSPGSTPVRLRARVRITDPSGTVVPGQRQIRVTSWSLSH